MKTSSSRRKEKGAADRSWGEDPLSMHKIQSLILDTTELKQANQRAGLLKPTRKAITGKTDTGVLLQDVKSVKSNTINFRALESKQRDPASKCRNNK